MSYSWLYIDTKTTQGSDNEKVKVPNGQINSGNDKMDIDQYQGDDDTLFLSANRGVAPEAFEWKGENCPGRKFWHLSTVVTPSSTSSGSGAIDDEWINYIEVMTRPTNIKYYGDAR